MKTEIQKVKYNEEYKTADWWTWKETCDRCGKTIREANVMITLSEPKVEIDLCLDCLFKLLDEKDA